MFKALLIFGIFTLLVAGALLIINEHVVAGGFCHGIIMGYVLIRETLDDPT